MEPILSNYCCLDFGVCMYTPGKGQFVRHHWILWGHSRPIDINFWGLSRIIFSCDEQLKELQCHSIRPSVSINMSGVERGGTSLGALLSNKNHSSGAHCGEEFAEREDSQETGRRIVNPGILSMSQSGPGATLLMKARKKAMQVC